MSVVFDRPYEFIPPHTGHWWPTFIQTFRLYDFYLRRAEGIVASEIRGLENLSQPLDRGDGIILTPNHCRYSDPLVLGWPARKLGIHLHALASWHLFNKGAFDQFALRRMGAFSLNREQSDRRSLEYSIDTIANATRPLVVFPEGATYRTNDFLKPLLDGVPFIARNAARRAAKLGRRVTMVPVALKYLCVDPVRPWAENQLLNFERRFGWRDTCVHDDLLTRMNRVQDAYLGSVQVRFHCRGEGPSIHQRRQSIIRQMLDASERVFEKDGGHETDPANRARAIRNAVAADFFSIAPVHDEVTLRYHSAAADKVLELASCPPHYIDEDQATDTRLVEVIQKIQEGMDGKSVNSIRLKVVIDIDQAIEIPAEKAPRGIADPLMTQLDERLRSKLGELSTLSNPL